MDKEQILYEQMCKLSFELQQEKNRHLATKKALADALEFRQFDRGQVAAYSSISKGIASEVAQILRGEIDNES